MKTERQHDALIIVDVQNDFCPGGALAVSEGDKIIPVINRLQPLFDTIVLSRDYHPPDHCSFAPDPKFIDKSWPAHCVAGTHGAEFHPDLIVPADALIIDKGIHKDREAYSCFQDSDLADRLRAENIRRLFITGLATDYCVKFTTLDALAAGFDVRVVTDAVKGVDIPPGSADKALQEMEHAGAVLIRSKDILNDGS